MSIDSRLTILLLMSFCSASLARAETDRIIFGASIAAECNDQWCQTRGSFDFYPGSLVSAALGVSKDNEKCAATIQNRSGFLKDDSIVSIGDGSLQSIRGDQIPGLKQLRDIERLTSVSIRIEFEMHSREDIEESVFLKLVQSTQKECRKRARSSPTLWKIVTSRSFAKLRVIIGIPKAASRASVLDAIKPFALETKGYFDVSVASADAVAFTGRSYVLFSAKTEDLRDYRSRYRNFED